jgi:hypothetical protein
MIKMIGKDNVEFFRVRSAMLKEIIIASHFIKGSVISIRAHINIENERV